MINRRIKVRKSENVEGVFFNVRLLSGYNFRFMA
jgi:hypothetical protein